MCGVSPVREEPGASKSWCFYAKFYHQRFWQHYLGATSFPYIQMSLDIWICFLLKSGQAWLDSLLKSYKVKVKMFHWVRFLSWGFGNNPLASSLGLVVDRITFLAVVDGRSLFPCWLLAAGAGGTLRSSRLLSGSFHMAPSIFKTSNGPLNPSCVLSLFDLC